MTMDQPNIKYRYALNKKDVVVDILALNEKDREDYYCLGCKRVLRPAMGKVRKKYFRHKVVDNCSLETYLHSMGVFLFQEAYQECLKNHQHYFLEEPVKNACKACQDGPCEIKPSTIVSDLTKKYSYSVAEKHDHVDADVFVPDVLLHDGQDQKIYVEIVVSHKASQKKIETAIPIIEIDISCEEDLELILGKRIPSENSRIRLLNFKEKIADVDYSRDCERLKARRMAEEIDREVKSRIKTAFQKAIKENASFNIVTRRPMECRSCAAGPCLMGEIIEDVDLLKFFRQIVEEPPGFQEINNRLAIVSEVGRKIYFETSGVFHLRLDNEAFLKSGIELIELEIGSIDFLSDIGSSKPRGIKYHFHNMNPKPIRHDDPKNCANRLHVFIVSKHGRARIEWMTFYEFDQIRNASGGYIKEVDDEDYKTFIREVEVAYLDGASVKNCYLCRYHAGANNHYKLDQSQRGGIFCKFLKQTCGSNQAAKCESYRPDPKVFGSERYPQRHGWR